MNGILNKSVLLFALSFVSCQALSANLTGKWTGKMTLDGSVLQKQLKDQSAKLKGDAKKQVDTRLKLINEGIQFVNKTKVRLDIKKGGIAFIEFTRNGKPEPEWCKWVAKDKQLTLSGFTGAGDSTMVLKGEVTESGKKLVFDMGFIVEKLMSSQGLKSSAMPKMTLVFRKS